MLRAGAEEAAPQGEPGPAAPEHADDPADAGEDSEQSTDKVTQVARRLKTNAQKLIHWDDQNCTLGDRLRFRTDMNFQMLLAHKKLQSRRK